MSALLSAFWNGSYAPHGYCLLWQPELIWTHVLADAVTALAYFTIPLALVALVRRRRDIAFGWVFWCFALFIMACGMTHVMSIVTLWYPLYGLEAVVKVVTAAASIATAILIWPLLPKAAALPSPAKLQAANEELATLVKQRDEALVELRAQIDHRERAEAALLQAQKLEAVGQLTGGIAHDFNNLLQAVAGNLELIAKRPEDPDRVIRWTGNALEAVDRGRSLTGQLLAFSRRQRLNLSAVRVHELIFGMRGLIERAVAPLASVKIGKIDRALTVRADALQLELAILNLAFNARDAMPEGGELTITAETVDHVPVEGLAPGAYAAISVADTGIGMTPEVREHALEPFFTTKEVGRGTGMGLSMVFGVVTQSGGGLTLESEPGKGTRITLYLRVSDTPPQREQLPDDAAGANVDLSGVDILLVDDDDQVRGALADVLTLAGAQVMQLDNGSKGLEQLREHCPDLLIVDFAMPGMTGADMLREVREIHKRLPIMLVTGYADSAKLDSVLNLGVEVLRKPFEITEFLAHAAAAIDRP